MTFWLTLILGAVLGGAIVWLVMRRDDKSSDIVVEAQLVASDIDVAAQAELDKKLEAGGRDREELARIDKIKDKRERYKAKADFANRNNPKRVSSR